MAKPHYPRKAMLCFKSPYGAFSTALRAVPPCSTPWLLTRLDEPEPFVDAPPDLGEDGSRISILQFGRLRAGIAGMSAKVGECRRKRTDVAIPIGTRKPMPVERRPPGPASKLHDALGNQVRILLRSLGDLVEQLALGHEMGSLDVPVGLSVNF